MATQSLYRRYRPRRFGELKGQEHVVRALRTAVANDRGGQAYMFSGPRGTGKTSAARILAKVLNCANPHEGEPCCECDSCLAIERGTSFDVLELDAASNNGVDNIRELIERAAMGNPGRHRVFILDEVHMLSAGAEAALLKTLEEPPPHVVFVLATTDPQKVSDTIRSRTQHLQFRLLASKDLEEHVRWVVADAKLEVSSDAIRQVVAQGAGSARDTLSALELVAASGGQADDIVRPEDIVEALIDHDPSAVLTQVAGAIQRGLDPRAFTESIVRYLREMFLSSMSPQLVQLSEEQAQQASALTARYGIASVVRAIEVLGEALIDIRRAPDPRLVMEVTLVRLTSSSIANDTASLIARIERLEAGTGRPRDVTGPIPRPRLGTPPASVAHKSPTTTTTTKPGMTTNTVAATPKSGSGSMGPSSTIPASASNPQPSGPVDDLVAAWPGLVRTLKATVRALYSAVEVVGIDQDSFIVIAPSEMHKKKCLELQETVVAGLSSAANRPIRLDIRVSDKSAVRTTESRQVATAVTHDMEPEPSMVESFEGVDMDDAGADRIESVVDQIAKQFPGARIVDTQQG